MPFIDTNIPEIERIAIPGNPQEGYNDNSDNLAFVNWRATEAVVDSLGKDSDLMEALRAIIDNTRTKTLEVEGVKVTGFGTFDFAAYLGSRFITRINLPMQSNVFFNIENPDGTTAELRLGSGPLTIGSGSKDLPILMSASPGFANYSVSNTASNAYFFSIEYYLP